MNRISWNSPQHRHIQLTDEKPSATPKRNIPVPKAALEDGILHLLATAAEMQQRQDLTSAFQLYEAAIAKIKVHGLNRKIFLNGTSKKPAPLNSKTPLEWSLHVGDVASAILLLGDANTALASLRTTVSLERLATILDSGASVEYRIGPHGRTLLLQEAAVGRYAWVCMALDRGASVACMDDNGDTALALALRSRAPQTDLIVKDLLNAGADLRIHDGSGQPLLQTALANAPLEAVKQVIEALLPLSLEDRQGMQEWAGTLQKTGTLDERTRGVLRLLLDHGLDPNLCQSGGNASLLDIVMTRDAGGSMVEELLIRNARTNFPSALRTATPRSLDLILTRLTPMTTVHKEQMATWFHTLPIDSKRWLPRDVEVLSLLVDFGLKPDTRQKSSPHAPLIVCAADNGNIQLVQKLAANKANLGAADDHGETALVRAAKKRDRVMYDALKAAGANDRQFFWTVWTSYAPG